MVTRSIWPLVVGAFLLLPSGLRAEEQQLNTPETTPARIAVWTAEMPAGKYIVLLSAITSVSQHEYIVDGAARVSEVNVATTGSELVRFYYIEPNIPQTPNGIGQSLVQNLTDKAQQAVERAGAEDVWRKVLKNYPTTTHAHTIEYRLQSRDSLDKLFTSVQRSWLRGRPETFKP